MRLLRCICSSFAGGLASATLLCASAPASQMTSSRLYDVTIETGMPHLEENLRYAVIRERLCLSQEEIFSVFPVLGHKALQGCKLGEERRRDDTSSWTLLCEGTHGTTGDARWFFDSQRITGTLNVKLGGKNMTFYQRVTLRPAGKCTSVAMPIRNNRSDPMMQMKS